MSGHLRKCPACAKHVEIKKVIANSGRASVWFANQFRCPNCEAKLKFLNWWALYFPLFFQLVYIAALLTFEHLWEMEITTIALIIVVGMVIWMICTMAKNDVIDFVLDED